MQTTKTSTIRWGQEVLLHRPWKCTEVLTQMLWRKIYLQWGKRNWYSTRSTTNLLVECDKPEISTWREYYCIGTLCLCLVFSKSGRVKEKGLQSTTTPKTRTRLEDELSSILPSSKKAEHLTNRKRSNHDIILHRRRNITVVRRVIRCRNAKYALYYDVLRASRLFVTWAFKEES